MRDLILDGLLILDSNLERAAKRVGRERKHALACRRRMWDLMKRYGLLEKR